MDILLSISLVSNRPINFKELLDNLEETARNPNRIEVTVRIDDGDTEMHALLLRESTNRRVKVKYISMPYTGFLNLYQSFNIMHEKLTSKNAYFLQHSNDEVRYTTKNWDDILEKYIGFFPDHIFRLRASKFKLWNYFSLDDALPFPENIPIVTKKWIDITGWCPSHSADSFQQMIACYLARGTPDRQNYFHRDIPIFDISFTGLDAAVGLSPKQQEQHLAYAHAAWKKLLSREMLINAQISANKLRTYIICDSKKIAESTVQFEIKNNIFYAKKNNGQVIGEFPFSFSLLHREEKPALYSKNKQLFLKTLYIFKKSLKILVTFIIVFKKLVNISVKSVMWFIRDIIGIKNTGIGIFIKKKFSLLKFFSRGTE